MSPPPYQKRNTQAQVMPSLNLSLPDKPNAAIETPLATASATVEFAVYVVDVFTYKSKIAIHGELQPWNQDFLIRQYQT